MEKISKDKKSKYSIQDLMMIEETMAIVVTVEDEEATTMIDKVVIDLITMKTDQREILEIDLVDVLIVKNKDTWPEIALNVFSIFI